MQKNPLKTKLSTRAFSLIEVVVALGVFAIAVVALLGVLASTSKTASDLVDSDVAAKLAANVESEMRRYAATLADFDTFASAVSASGAELYATKTGERVVISNAAGANLDGNIATQPTGIRGRDRYFILKVNRLPAPLYTSGDGFVALSVSVEWPYQLPLGPDDGSLTVGTLGSDFSRTDDEDRSVYLITVAVTP